MPRNGKIFGGRQETRVPSSTGCLEERKSDAVIVKECRERFHETIRQMQAEGSRLCAEHWLPVKETTKEKIESPTAVA